ncbi:MAG TPA: hypothetical protein VGL35_07550 [Rhizomicrobium sp.]|jgi:hypothetical protein
MSSTTQIEHEAESHRAHISQLVEELRERATPGEVLDQFLDWQDGREIARTFGRQIRDNPLPLAFIGTGVAWLMASDTIRSRRPVMAYTERTRAGFAEVGHSAADTTTRAASGARDAARSATEWTRATASGAADATQSALDSGRGAASDFADSAQSAVGRARQSVSDTAAGISDSASSAWGKTSGMAQNTADTVRQAGSSLKGIAREQPLLVAGIGLALGMALGALLPASETENQMFGEQADALRDRASELAGEGYRKAGAVAQRSYDAATEAAKVEAVQQGLANKHRPDGASHPSDGSTGESVTAGGKNGGDFGSSAYPHH